MSPQQLTDKHPHHNHNMNSHDNDDEQGITLRWRRITKRVELTSATGASNLLLKKHVEVDEEAPSNNDMAVNSNEKVILDDVTGAAYPGEVLALMGPSGSGKTSLLDVLSGRSSYDTNSGAITVNGAVANPTIMKWLKRRIAYVKQRDLFFDHLTVRDQLTYTALLRLPCSKEESLQEVERIISLLRLTQCADSSIFMISGGERKRVNIGTELLTNPDIIILDEPTSGLDSTSANNLIALLKDLALTKRKTIISSIHQPSSSALFRFDKLMLLADGHVVFYGTPKTSLSYLSKSEINMPCPSGYNAADHWMDLLVIDSASDDLNKSHGNETDSIVTSSKQKLIDSWDADHIAAEMAALDTELLGKRSKIHADFVEGTGKVISSTKYGAPWSKQLMVLTHRSLKNSRTAVFTWLNFVKSGLIGIVMGFVWFQMDYTEETVNDRSAYYFFTMTFWVFDAMFMAFMAFPLERDLIFKERASGTYHLSAYFIAKTLSEAPTRLTLPLVYMVFSYWLAGLNNSVTIFIGSTLCTLLSVFCGESIGLFIGASIMDFEKGMVAMTVISLGLMAVGGFFVENIPPFLVWIQFLSPFKFAFDASQQLTFDRDVPCDGSGTLEEYCFESETGYATVDEVREYLDINGSVLFNVAMLFLISLVCRTGAFLALKSKKGEERS